MSTKGESYNGNIKDYQLTSYNLHELFTEIQKHLEHQPFLLVNVQNPKIGKWGMAKLWRSWMGTTAEFMAANGAKMPLMIKADGSWYGERAFSANDAHELFTSQWLGLDADGTRLSWAKSPHSGMRTATRGERFNALRRHEEWALNKGIKLWIPRESEYSELQKQQNQ